MSEEKALTKAQEKKPVVTVGDHGLVLNNLDEMYRFAQMVVASKLGPKGLDNAASAMVAIQMGMELGLPAMTAIRGIAVINGRPSLWGDVALAVVMNSPKFEDIEEEIEGEGDKAVGVCRVWKRGREKPIERRFSMNDAKQAGLLGKQGPWQQYPKRMLQMRARSWAMRDAFPGALSGLYVKEEAEDMPPLKRVEAEEIPAKEENVMDDYMAKQNDADAPQEPVEDEHEEAEPEEAEVTYEEDTAPWQEPEQEDEQKEQEDPEPDDREATGELSKKQLLAAIDEEKAKKKPGGRNWGRILNEAGSIDGRLDGLSETQLEKVLDLLEGMPDPK